MPPRSKILPQSMQDGYRNSQVRYHASNVSLIINPCCLSIYWYKYFVINGVYGFMCPNASACMLFTTGACMMFLILLVPQMLKYGFLKMGGEVTTIAGAAGKMFGNHK